MTLARRYALLLCVVALGALMAFPAIAGAAYRTWSPQSLDTSSTGVNAAAIADFTGDGKLDVLANDSGSNALSLFPRTTGTSFGAQKKITDAHLSSNYWAAAFRTPSAARGALVANQAADTVSVFLPDGSGSLAWSNDVALPAGSQPVQVIVADFNNDNKDDFATLNSATDEISIRLGTGAGAFSVPATASPEFLSVGIGVSAIAAGDVNNDGKTDLCVATTFDSGVVTYLGHGTGGFTAVQAAAVPVGPVIDLPTAPRSVSIADVNGDGRGDVVTANSSPLVPSTSAYATSVLLANSGGGLGSYTTYAAGVSPYVVATGDLDGDGSADLATVDTSSSPDFTTGPVDLLANSGSGSFSALPAATSLPFQWFVGIGDVNSDGTNDLVTTTDVYGPTSSGKVGVLYGDNAPPTSTLVKTPSGTWANTDTTVTIDATDTASGVAATYFTVNGGPTTLYAGPFKVPFEGITTITYWSVDNVGFVESSHSATVRIDSHQPNVAVSGIANGAWVGHDETFTVSAADSTVATSNVSGIASVAFTQNGGLEQPYTVPVTISDEGTTTVVGTATDNAGNVGSSAPVVAMVDKSAPHTDISGVSSNWVIADILFTLVPQDSYSGVASTQYRLDGGVVTPYTAPVPITDSGTHLIEYRSIDNVGNVEKWQTFTVKLDKTKPSTTTDMMPTYTGGAATVHFFPTDTYSGVAQTQVSVDGALATSTTAITVYTLGTHTLAWQSTDVAGNVETLNLASFEVLPTPDTTAPVTTMIPAPSPAWTNTDFGFKFNATDVGGSGVRNTFYWLTAASAQSVATYTPDSTVTISASGATVVHFFSVDTKGNTETEQTATVLVDKIAPVITTVVNSSYNYSASISITANDSLSGVATEQWSLDNGPWQSSSTCGVTKTGSHTLRVQATDNAGNSSGIVSYSFMVKSKTTVSNPSCGKSTISRKSTYAYKGSVKPKSSTTSSAVKIYFYQYTGGKWVYKKVVTANCRQYSNYTQYSAGAKITVKGRWRARAIQSTSRQYGTSGYTYLTVK